MKKCFLIYITILMGFANSAQASLIDENFITLSNDINLGFDLNIMTSIGPTSDYNPSKGVKSVPVETGEYIYINGTFKNLTSSTATLDFGFSSTGPFYYLPGWGGPALTFANSPTSPSWGVVGTRTSGTPHVDLDGVSLLPGEDIVVNFLTLNTMNATNTCAFDVYILPNISYLDETGNRTLIDAFPQNIGNTRVSFLLTNPVPEPSTIILFAIGLLWLTGMGQKTH